MKQSDINVFSKIKKIGGVPRLFINNKLIEADSYISYKPESKYYENFSKIGFNIYSIPIYFSTRTVNESSQIEPLGEGIFDSKSGFKIIDDEVNKLLSVNPNAYIFFRVDTSLPKSWDEENPLELNDKGLNGFPARPCLSSKKYLEDVKKHLTLVIEYIQNSEYADRVFGYQISGGMTQEWLANDIDGNNGVRLREAYKEYLDKNELVDSYATLEKFKSNQNADFVCSLAKHIKELTENRLVVGSFFGYICAVLYSRYGHLAIERLLTSKDIDFMCAPIAYYTERKLGIDHPLMIPLASLHLHNKMYFAENDTRTDLSKPFGKLDAYRTPIWFGPEREKSLEITKMHFASSLCKGSAYWWFDMWGGWYDDPSYLNQFKYFKQLSHEALNCSNESCSEIAIIVDEESMCNVSDDALLNKTNRDIYPLLGNIGVSYDVYESHDFNDIYQKYKLIILLSPCQTDCINKMAKACENANIDYLVINKDTELNEGTLLNNILKASVNRHFPARLILYENKSYLYIQGIEEAIINKPSDLNLIPLIDKVKFPLKLEKGKGYLFRKE